MTRIYGSFEDADGVHGYTRDDLEEMSREQKIRVVVDWFHANFEDPAHRLPYISREGGYQWIYGGPYDALEEIESEFSDVIDFEIIQEAVEDVQSGGLFDWAPKEKPGDYDDSEYDERVYLGEVVDGDGEWPPVIPVDRPRLEEPEARQEVIRRLDHLEELIRPLVAPKGMMGHNHPPEPIEVEYPCTRAEWIALNQAVQIIREQTRIDEPDETRIVASTRILRSLGTKLASWLQVRVEKGIDAAVVAIGTTAGASALVNIQAIVDGMGRVVQAVSHWIQTLPTPF